jgi:Ca-activated chloride channel homolog
MVTRRPAILFTTSLVMAAMALAMASVPNPNLWSSPDQRADRLFRQGHFMEASMAFSDPYRRGVALYRAGEFKAAAAALATIATPETAFDRGNALVMQGKYADAIASYDRALSLRPGWRIAADNRAIAVVRRDRMRFEGGDAIGGQLKADRIVFGKQKEPRPGEQTEVAEGERISDEALRELWLRRVQTKPADFLRAKFAFQAQSREGNAP